MITKREARHIPRQLELDPVAELNKVAEEVPVALHVTDLSDGGAWDGRPLASSRARLQFEQQPGCLPCEEPFSG